MQITNRLIPSTLVLALVTVVLGVCGNGASTEDWPETGGNSGTSSGSIPQTCLTAVAVSSTLGLKVREFREMTRAYDNNIVCGYQATDERFGVFVTTIIGPTEQSDKIFREMKESVKLLLGTNAEPEVIQVGERGHAYGSSTRSAAAAVSGDRLYCAEVMSMELAIGDKKAGVIELVKKLMGRSSDRIHPGD